MFEICLEVFYDFYDNDIEINDINESFEYCIDIIVKDLYFKVFLFLEYWNMEVEDVLEFLIID